MPDAFLRRVLAQRELEQEQAILDTPLEAFAPEHCRLCGARLSSTDSASRLGRATVCSNCGGRKRQLRLEAEDAERERSADLRRRLVLIAGFNPLEGVMSERKCVKCQKKLRSNNTSDTCWGCRHEGVAGAPAEAAPGSKGRRAAKDLRKNFAAVARALGEDPEELINAFCEGWLETLRRSHARMSDDAYAPPVERAA